MRRLAGSKARTHGERFESLIERTCRSYSREGVAEIRKTPEPLRVVQPLGKGQFRAVFTKKAQPDFQGTLTGGRSVVFEAKHTQTTNLPFDRVNPEQARDLDTHHKMGALCFILVSFKFEDFYAIEWQEWLNLANKSSKKSFNKEDAKRFKIEPEGLKLPFLDVLRELEKGE